MISTQIRMPTLQNPDPVLVSHAFLNTMADDVIKLEVEKEMLRVFIAIVLCWKPEWTQTTYFQKLPRKLRIGLIVLAKCIKHEGSGGVDSEWLDALAEL